MLQFLIKSVGVHSWDLIWYAVTGLLIPRQRNSGNVLSSIVVFQQLQWVLLPEAD